MVEKLRRTRRPVASGAGGTAATRGRPCPARGTVWRWELGSGLRLGSWPQAPIPGRALQRNGFRVGTDFSTHDVIGHLRACSFAMVGRPQWCPNTEASQVLFIFSVGEGCCLPSVLNSQLEHPEVVDVGRATVRTKTHDGRMANSIAQLGGSAGSFSGVRRRTCATRVGCVRSDEILAGAVMSSGRSSGVGGGRGSVRPAADPCDPRGWDAICQAFSMACAIGAAFLEKGDLAECCVGVSGGMGPTMDDDR